MLDRLRKDIQLAFSIEICYNEFKVNIIGHHEYNLLLLK